MNGRIVLFATLLCIVAVALERSPMLHAAEENAKEPGPSDKGAPKEFTATDSGLKFRILRKSNGVKPTEIDTVKVHYKGWLDNGKEFDSSYGPKGEPIKFPLKGVIAGWTEGLQLVGKGGMIELEIPYELGYGEEGSPPIPPKARLHFIVELLDVIPPPKPGSVDKDAPEEFQTTKSGLKYRIRRKSDEDKPAPNDSVSVHYKGWFDDGEPFDSSYDRGEQTKFPLKGVIRGWTEGLQLIGKSGMIELEVPYELAYGEEGRPGIPPKARLHFLIELFEIIPGPKPVDPGSVDKDAPEEFQTTKSGLKFRIRRKSNGDKPTVDDVVEVHYKGWLDSGDTFDSSYDRGVPATFPLKRVIRGWTEGMQLIGKGGMIELEIPYDLAYGEEGRPGRIPPKAKLHFLVELLDIK